MLKRTSISINSHFRRQLKQMKKIDYSASSIKLHRSKHIKKPKSNFPNKPSNKPISSSTTKILAKIHKTTKLKNHGITQQTRTQTNQPHYKTSKTRQIKPPNPKKKEAKNKERAKSYVPVNKTLKH